MKKTPIAVAAIMPPMTPMPIEFWAPEPALLAKASGATPRMKANDVMRMGRRRCRAASSVASTRPIPESCRAMANSTIRMAFLAASPIVVSNPTLK